MKNTSRKVSDTRDLTDKELADISRAFGNGVRSQTITVAGIVQATSRPPLLPAASKPPSC